MIIAQGFCWLHSLCHVIIQEYIFVGWSGVVLGVAQLCNKKTGTYFTTFDEDIASAFAVYCCISISHVSLSFCTSGNAFQFDANQGFRTSDNVSLIIFLFVLEGIKCSKQWVGKLSLKRTWMLAIRSFKQVEVSDFYCQRKCHLVYWLLSSVKHWLEIWIIIPVCFLLAATDRDVFKDRRDLRVCNLKLPGLQCYYLLVYRQLWLPQHVSNLCAVLFSRWCTKRWLIFSTETVWPMNSWCSTWR